ncbi:putative sodium-dependent multivitamin transporter isoform X1 [Stegodyphus dumicola]|uniref:putative sodium-dependent multivitamin transporter isoform X1 n=2 Tax=Stegodyphus dumicola TaxID=202533 RepID=UPI0015ADE3C9|nr:putative sodium-dependent multivitamin transporter isoform X1 [Stegodyphus dumicola]
MTSEKLILGAADYTILGITLSISAALGLYFRFSGNKQKTNDEYLLAGKDMSILPVAFSLMASFFSATILMGLPAEMYDYGTNMVFMNIGFSVGPVIAAYLFIPIFFNTGITTAYEYLEKRFGTPTRRILSALFIFQNVLFTSVTLFAPALALSVVTNLSLTMSVISVGVVCTFYCTLGGMKAVLWTDVIQAILMYTCLLTIAIKGCMNLGGISEVFRIAQEGGRLVIPKVSFDPEAHYTIFSVAFLGLVITISAYAGNQVQVQRMLTLKNSKRATIATVLSAPMLVAFHLLCCLCGLIFYATYRLCDPMTSPEKPIQSADQLMPYYIATTMSGYPGLPGLCIAGIFSASLSTISSELNSFAAVMAEDFIKPIWPRFKNSVFITKIISLIYGALCIALSFLVASIGNLLKTTIVVVGMIAGPNLAVFLLASLTTTTNEEGIIFGIIASVAVSSYLSFMPTPTFKNLPLSNECPEQNLTSNIINATLAFTTPTSSSFNTTNSDVQKDAFYVSYMWITPLAMVICLVIGYISSIIVLCFRNKPEVPMEYLSPVRRWFSERNIHKEKDLIKISSISKPSIPLSELGFSNPQLNRAQTIQQ